MNIEKMKTVKNLADYKGVCHRCNTHFVKETIGVVLIGETDSTYDFEPLEKVECPNCKGIFSMIQVYKSFDVTVEIEAIRNQIKE